MPAVAQTFYLLCPLLVCAACAGVVLKLDLWKALARPLDGGVTVRGRRLFGDNKTFRVPAAALAGAIATVSAQKYLVGDRAGALALLDYARANPFLLGAAIGGGAMLGELPNSFLKRQLDIPPSGTTRGRLRPLFYFLDQVDLLLVTWPLLLFWVRPSRIHVALSVALVFAIHPLVALAGYLSGARRGAR